MDASDLLPLSLAMAVPMWTEDLKRLPLDEVMARASASADIVASQGDAILYRSSKKGETAKAFNALAEGMAALSFSPGGVKAFGLHFEATHPEQVSSGDDQEGP